MNLRLPKAIEDVVRTPTWPGTLPRVIEPRNLGVDYDTSWARAPWAKAARRVLVETVTRPVVAALTSPTIYGREHLAPIAGPMIFAVNHSSHLDTSVVIASLPERIRHRTVVAAAADYFFDRPWKAALWSLALGTIPMERTKLNRKSADLAAELIDAGWSLVIFPEGGRSPDGWGQEFRGGAAYLAKRTGAPVIPVHLRGVRPVLPKGASAIRRHDVEVRFGDALWPIAGGPTGRDEDARRFAARIEEAVAILADEAETDWWSARRRAAQGATPPFRGPEASPWRRTWSLPESARKTPKRRQRSSAEPW